MSYSLVINWPRFRRIAKRVAVAGLWVVGAGGLLALVFGVSFYLAMRVEMRSTEVSVPDMAGMNLEEAHLVAEGVDLVPLVVDQRHDPAVPSGRVLQQVPNIVGQSARAVEIELRQRGFMPGYEVRLPSSEVSSGTVMAQVPPVDTPAVPNTRVHRLVSSGPAQQAWVMPDLTGISRRDAERWIADSNFRAAVRQVRGRRRLSGKVVGQLPLAGYPVHRNDVVEISIAR